MNEFKKIKYSKHLKDINSPYIIKTVFSFLYEKQKLNMMIYNKELQSLLLVDIKDYKKLIGKYKIGE